MLQYRVRAPQRPGQRFSISSKPGYFLGFPGFSFVLNRVRRSFLFHEQKPDYPDDNQEHVAYGVDGICIHGHTS